VESQFLITELFNAKAGKTGWDRCFYGTIKRDIDADGHPVFGKIKVLDGFICAMASNQWKLGDILDELVLMVLDYDIRKHPAIMTFFAVSTMNLN